MFEASDQVKTLADALGPALGLASAAKVDAWLPAYAEKRHRIAPLLNLAVNTGSSEASEATRGQLAEFARRNGRRVLSQRAATIRLEKVLGSQGIRFASIKGFQLGASLYGSDNLRHSKDVDFLLPDNQADAAIRLLADNGYQLLSGGALELSFVRAKLHHHREVSLRDPVSKVELELHSRVFNRNPDGWSNGFFFDQSLDMTNARYVLYLILHGASCHWHRLKWLADLFMIAKLVEPPVRDEIVSLAREFHCLPAIAASFRACAALWASADLSDWLERIALPRDDRHARLFEVSFAEALHRTTENSPRRSFVQKYAIVREPPIFGKKYDGRLKLLRSRGTLWWLNKVEKRLQGT